MSPNDVTIRQARKDDCNQILGLIHELAEYENMPECVKMTEARLQEDGFPEKGSPAFVVHVAEVDTKLIGMAFHYFTYSTWEGRSIYLEDLYVTPSWRKKGVGFRLFATVSSWAVRTGCSRVNFSVLGWNHMAKKFYDSIGAVNLSEKEQWESCRVAGKALQALAERADEAPSCS